MISNTTIRQSPDPRYNKKNPKLFSKTKLNSSLTSSNHNHYTHLRVLLDESLSLDDVLGEVLQASLDESLLVLVDLSNGKDLLNSLGSENDLGGEELDTLVLVEGRVNEGALDDLLSGGGAEKRVSHAGSGESHGEGL